MFILAFTRDLLQRFKRLLHFAAFVSKHRSRFIYRKDQRLKTSANNEMQWEWCQVTCLTRECLKCEKYGTEECASANWRCCECCVRVVKWIRFQKFSVRGFRLRRSGMRGSGYTPFDRWYDQMQAQIRDLYTQCTTETIQISAIYSKLSDWFWVRDVNIVYRCMLSPWTIYI